ncbi:MAG: hypothetical protein IKP83_03545 [Bacteroidales bacterium]|nr:hypothetical protein [Bacteroidales bacterium]
MKKFFSQDTVLVGIVAGLGAEFGFAIVLAIGLLIAGEPIQDHIRWFAGMFIPLIFVLRHYIKDHNHLRVTRTLIALFFVTFLAFMLYLLKARILVLQ